MANGWTPERRARQSQLIHKWKPWEKSTGASTPEGKKISSKNAVNYSLREVMREMARQSRELLNYLKGWTPPPTWDRAVIDSLLDDLEKTFDR